MDISEVRMVLAETTLEDDDRPRVLAYCSVLFDNTFVVKEIKLIKKREGDGILLAMPSRKFQDHCPSCQARTDIDHLFCGKCGLALRENRANVGDKGILVIRIDIAHPINDAFRRQLEEAIVSCYNRKLAEQKLAEAE